MSSASSHSELLRAMTEILSRYCVRVDFELMASHDLLETLRAECVQIGSEPLPEQQRHVLEQINTPYGAVSIKELPAEIGPAIFLRAVPIVDVPIEEDSS